MWLATPQFSIRTVEASSHQRSLLLPHGEIGPTAAGGCGSCPGDAKGKCGERRDWTGMPQDKEATAWIESSKLHAKSCILGDATVPVCSSVKLFQAQVACFLLGAGVVDREW